MRELKYGYYGEDEAHRIFLINYLEQLLNYLGKSEEVTFNFDEFFTYKFKGRNKSEVDARFAEAAQEGFIEYQQDLFFVGRDMDTHLGNIFKDKITSMQSQLRDDFKDKTFLMIPVQCIEHWLWYMKIKVEKPSSTKNESLESKPNREAKIALYGSAKVSNKISIPIVEKYSKLLDIDYLLSRSESFMKFHNQVKDFIVNLIFWKIVLHTHFLPNHTQIHNRFNGFFHVLHRNPFVFSMKSVFTRKYIWARQTHE